MASRARGATPGWWGQQGVSEPSHGGPWGQQTGLAGVNPTAAKPLTLLGTPQDSVSHVTVLPLHLHSMSSSPYDYEISGPLGRDNYKEMYLFIYR